MEFEKTKIGKIPTKWIVASICDIGDVVGGGTPKKTVDEYWNGDISWITPKDLSNYNRRLICTGHRKITNKGLCNSSAKLLPKGTVLFSSRAPIGYLAIAGKELCTNQGFKSIICNKEKINNYFLYYLLIVKRRQLENIAGGSTFKEISGKVLKEFEIPLPPIEEQNVIARMLSLLDDKIELNTRINQNLEEMAQAIFKHWFVDFEFPDENGNPYKSSGGKMIESELGRIPEGWEVVSVSEIADILSGGTPKTKIKRYWDGNIPFFTPKDARNGCYTLDTEKLITKEGLEKCNSRLYGKDTIFITARGTVGKLNLASRNMAMNQSCYAIWHKNDRQYYMLFSLRSIIKKIINNASGAVFSAINVKDFNTFKLVNAPDSIIKNFDCIVHPIFEHILALSNQNKILESVRDTLLPKLMSGEIRVPTEQMVR